MDEYDRACPAYTPGRPIPAGPVAICPRCTLDIPHECGRKKVILVTSHTTDAPAQVAIACLSRVPSRPSNQDVKDVPSRQLVFQRLIKAHQDLCNASSVYALFVALPLTVRYRVKRSFMTSSGSGSTAPSRPYKNHGFKSLTGLFGRRYHKNAA